MHLVLIAQDYQDQHSDLMKALDNAGIGYQTCKNDEIDISIAVIQNKPDFVVINSSRLEHGAVNRLCSNPENSLQPQRLINVYSYEDSEEIKRLNELGIRENHPFPCSAEHIVKYICDTRRYAPADISDLTLRISRMLTEILVTLGRSERLRGNLYIRDAVMMLLFDKPFRINLHGDIYQRIAEKYDTSIKSVEHSIRISIDSCWKNGDEQSLQHIMGSCITDNRKPTNSSFIIALAKAMRNDNIEYFNMFTEQITNSTGTKLHI